MRLRTRLAIAFAFLALVPLSVVLPFAQANLRRTLSRELETRAEIATAAARSELQRRSGEVRRAIDELAVSAALEDFAQELSARAPLGQQASVAERLMRARGLGVLSIFDAQGTTLSSGHLPARLGDPDPPLFRVTERGEAAPVALMVELRDETGLRQAPALVAARAVDYGELRLWVVGGQLLDTPLTEHLARLAGARVELLHSTDGLLASAGQSFPPELERTFELSPEIVVKLSLSRAAFLEAEQGLTRAFALVVGLGLSLAVLLGLLVSLRITRPVEALTSGARRVAGGDLSRKVEARASGEVGELVSAFNRMVDELEGATRKLVASERIAAWQEVARRLAHEIKNPLTPIRMSLETLLAANQAGNPRFPGLFQESAAVILEEVDRLRRIVDEFSRFARLPKPQLAPLDLAELVGQVLSLYATPPPAGVELVPELDAGITVQADRDQLTQVLVNLIKNAGEALPDGGRVWVRVKARDGHAMVEVEDTGRGIKPEDLPHVFEPYFTTKSGGTGLGLAIASRICQEHGGALEVSGGERASGKGALFRVVLPASG